MEEHFEKLEELIKDDDKIVTVASFAAFSHIPIEESQKIIDKYVEINKESKELYLTYILHGIKKDWDTFSVAQVNDKTLEEEKQLFYSPTVIIFSIQRAKHVDYNIISLVEQEWDKKNGLSGIIAGKNCVKRILRKKVLPALPPATIKGKSVIFMKQGSSGSKSEVKSEENCKTDEKSSQETKTKNNAQSSIGSMFNKAANTKKSEQKTAKTPEQKPKKSGSLSNFFTKQPEKAGVSIKSESTEIKKSEDIKKVPKEKELKEEKLDIKSNGEAESKNQKDIKKSKKTTELFDSDTDEEILKDLEMQEEKPVAVKTEKKNEKAKSTQNKSKTPSKKKKREKTDNGNDKSAKKRRRIIVEDSDSDDIFGSDKSDNEDIVEKSDEESAAAKQEIKPLPPKNKRRKSVKKMYEDEEGFIVTQTEYVYETASEDENEPDNKISRKEVKPNPKLEKKSSNNSEKELDLSPTKAAKGKKGAKKAPSGTQPTLMNFFTKR